MTPLELATKIRKLRAQVPLTAEFEGLLIRRHIWDGTRVWYTSQKEHWLGWLGEYRGPGYYGRKNFQRSAEFAYNHIVCPPMLLWLCEASGVSKLRIEKARRAASSAKGSLSARSA